MKIYKERPLNPVSKQGIRMANLLRLTLIENAEMIHARMIRKTMKSAEAEATKAEYLAAYKLLFGETLKVIRNESVVKLCLMHDEITEKVFNKSK
jgi:hypothetical protein